MENVETKKLNLNKKRITRLSTQEMANVLGGEAAASTVHNFTCSLCTSGNGPVKVEGYCYNNTTKWGAAVGTTISF